MCLTGIASLGRSVSGFGLDDYCSSYFVDRAGRRGSVGSLIHAALVLANAPPVVVVLPLFPVDVLPHFLGWV